MAQKYKFDWDAVRTQIQTEEAKKKSFEKDTRFYEVQRDANGLATVIFRFLPDPNGQPWVKYYSHSFKYIKNEATKWWIRNCINTFGYDQECPICKKNQILYNSAYQSDKDIAGARKRKLSYISNILIIQDKANPENEGKVFLYRYGQKIHDKIKKHLMPSDQDREDPDFVEFVPFDPYEGANFKLKVTKQGDFPNYDTSAFSPNIGPLGDDKKIEAIMSKTFDLSEFVAKDKFPTNDEVMAALSTVLQLPTNEETESAPKGKRATGLAVDDDDADSGKDARSALDDTDADTPKATTATGKKSSGKKASPPPAEPDDDDASTGGDEGAASGSDEDDPDLKFFQNLR